MDARKVVPLVAVAFLLIALGARALIGCGEERAVAAPRASTVATSTPDREPALPPPMSTTPTPVAIRLEPVPVVEPQSKADLPRYDATSDAYAKVSGRAVFKGERPKRALVPVLEECKALHPDKPLLTEREIVNAKNLGIKNVFVWIASGAERCSYPEPAEPAVLDQKGCRYEPHVFGMRPGQKLLIRNSDPFTHNVHYFGKSREINKAQAAGAPPLEETLRVVEEAGRFKCDIHSWMTAWVFVLPHPLFAVTDADGAFALPPLPAGEYEIAAWHEEYGRKSQRVTAKESEAREVQFGFGR